MSRAQVSKHYARILSQWPVDSLRPQISFQSLLRKRIEAAPVAQSTQPHTSTAQGLPQAAATDATSELKQINALYSLLENRYSRINPVSEALMRPTSDPNHYTNLQKELEELPNRSWFGNFMNKLKSRIRMS